MTQGDKWMRLPSVAFDSKDLIRSLSIADGPEEIIDAEEYLHPQEPDVVDSPQNKVGAIPLLESLYTTPAQCWAQDLARGLNSSRSSWLQGCVWQYGEE